MSDRTDETDADPAAAAAGEADIDSGTGAGDRPDRGRDERDRSTRIANEERRRTSSITSGLVAALGAWVAVSVLVFETGEASLWNNVLVGAAIVLVAGTNGYRLTRDEPLSLGLTALAAVLGSWLVVSAVAIGMIGSLFWSTVAAGLLIVILAGYNAYEAREARRIVTDADTSP